MGSRKCIGLGYATAQFCCGWGAKVLGHPVQFMLAAVSIAAWLCHDAVCCCVLLIVNIVKASSALIYVYASQKEILVVKGFERLEMRFSMAKSTRDHVV